MLLKGLAYIKVHVFVNYKVKWLTAPQTFIAYIIIIHKRK